MSSKLNKISSTNPWIESIELAHNGPIGYYGDRPPLECFTLGVATHEPFKCCDECHRFYFESGTHFLVTVGDTKFRTCCAGLHLEQKPAEPEREQGWPDWEFRGIRRKHV